MDRPPDFPESISDKFRYALKWGMWWGMIVTVAMLVALIFSGRNVERSPLEIILLLVGCGVPAFFLMSINFFFGFIWREVLSRLTNKLRERK